MVKVSVIVPVYNMEKYLQQCLDSLLVQTLEDIEIICVNDGSTDSSAEILACYVAKDERIKVINKPNGGLSSARNAGIRKAIGEYIGFVDSDDYIAPDFYEKLYQTAKRAHANIVATNIIKFNSEKQWSFLTFEKFKSMDRLDKKYRLFNLPFFCYVWNKIYNREKLLNANLWFREGELWEDMYFIHKALYYMGRVAVMSDSAYYYRVRADSIIGSNDDNKIYWHQLQNRRALIFLQSRGVQLKQSQLDQYRWDKQVLYKLFGLSLFSIRGYGAYKQYYLFNRYKIFERQETNKQDFFGLNLTDKNIFKTSVNSNVYDIENIKKNVSSEPFDNGKAANE